MKRISDTAVIPDAIHAESTGYLEGIEDPDTINHMPPKLSSTGIVQTRIVSDVENADDFDFKVSMLIDAFIDHGHTASDLGLLDPEAKSPKLNIADYRFSEDDFTRYSPLMDRFSCVDLQSLILKLQRIFCGKIALEVLSISDVEEKQWLVDFFCEHANMQLSAEHVVFLEKTLAAELFELELNRHYQGQKRFSLEGNESFIALMEMLLEGFVSEGIDEFVVGMAHRGRLNFQANVMGMSLKDIHDLFKGDILENKNGDVKYHLGFSVHRDHMNQDYYLNLCANPSHLEAVYPIVQGEVRARGHYVKLHQHKTPESVLGIVVHGDASIAGQGVVYECLNMSQTSAYYTGGSVHVVINNQIGFTTLPKDGRSSRYCTDIAKLLPSPVVHVHAGDMLALMRAVKLAVAYRARFSKDIFIDLIGSRKRGHNESEDPRSANPNFYHRLEMLTPITAMLVDQYIEHGIIDRQAYENMILKIERIFEEGGSIVKRNDKHSWQYTHWQKYQGTDWRLMLEHKKIDLELIKKLSGIYASYPDNFVFNKQAQRVYDQRLQMYAGDVPMDWGSCEILAYGHLLSEGISIRLTGQDVDRGTFSHRFSSYEDVQSGHRWNPWLIDEFDGDFEVYNSTLSEYGALGFEYGYSQVNAENLVIWEAQFGDFANNAQVVFDQFIASAWQKWKVISGLVVYLPHGYEGAGPEHSSARIERFLQLASKNNMQVVVPTTPSQMYHLLMRQMFRSYKRPLIVMTPKSLLRHKKAVSTLTDLTDKRFETVLDDQGSDKKSFERVIFCCGKIYFELLERRDVEGLDKKIAIIRLEQLYPFPSDHLIAVLQAYVSAKTFLWVQEEPKNQGCWYMLKDRIDSILPDDKKLLYVGRDSMSASSEGRLEVFLKNQNALITRAILSQ